MTVEDEPEPAPHPRGRGCLIPAVIASTILVLMCGAGGILRYANVFRPVGVAPPTTGPTAGPPTETPRVPSPSPTPSATVPPTTTPPTTTSPKPPRVDTLKVTQAPTCTSTGSPGTYTGQIQLQWTVSGSATGSQLFADGSLVNTYGKTQTATLPFACDGSPGATVTHTYTVKTVGGAPQATRSVTATATIPS